MLPGDRVIIATDGLDTISAGAIIQYSAWSKTAKECVQAFLTAVEEAGKPRQDNTTVVVVDVIERGTVRDEEEPTEKPDIGDTLPLYMPELQEVRAAAARSAGEKTAPEEPITEVRAPEEPITEVRAPEEPVAEEPPEEIPVLEELVEEPPAEEHELEVPSLDDITFEEPAEEPPAEPVSYEPAYEAPYFEEPKPKKGKGLIIGLALVALLAIGAGAYYKLVLREGKQFPFPVVSSRGSAQARHAQRGEAFKAAGAR